MLNMHEKFLTALYGGIQESGGYLTLATEVH